jgi:ribosomal protein S30
MNPNYAIISPGKIRAQTGKIRARRNKKRSKKRPRIRKRTVMTGNRNDRRSIRAIIAINGILTYAIRL